MIVEAKDYGRVFGKLDIVKYCGRMSFVLYRELPGWNSETRIKIEVEIGRTMANVRR